jgi:lipoprotein-releasing system ATP-binding protein
MNETPVLRARGLSKGYGAPDQRVEVLLGLDLDVHTGESLAIVGDSGVGKSTLLHLLGGLERPDRGQVEFRGSNIHGGAGRDLAGYRNRHVGFVFQLHHLLPEFTALENVQMPFRVGRRPQGSGDLARRLLERLGLESRMTHYPGQLSGGEQQRVAIARALALEPAVVLADEPTGNLDPGTGGAVFGLLRELQRERPFALVMATHSERLARGCDRLARLAEGRVRTMGESEAREYFDGLGA